jgi:chorismate mutase
MRIVEQMAECKLASSVTTFQVARWKALLDDRMTRAAHVRLDADYVKALYEVIHGESLRCQSEITSAPRTGVPASPPSD